MDARREARQKYLESLKQQKQETGDDHGRAPAASNNAYSNSSNIITAAVNPATGAPVSVTSFAPNNFNSSNINSNSAGTANAHVKSDAVSKREQLLEEKRRAFFDKKASSGAANPAVVPTGFQETKYDPYSNSGSNTNINVNDNSSNYIGNVAVKPLNTRLFDLPMPSSILQNQAAPMPTLGSTPATNNLNFNANTSNSTNAMENAILNSSNITTNSQKSKSINDDVQLSRWKSEGFPSEYAYAKHLGLLNLQPASKPQPQQNNPTYSTTSTNKVAFELPPMAALPLKANSNSSGYNDINSNFPADNKSSLGGSGPGLGLGGIAEAGYSNSVSNKSDLSAILSEKNDKRRKQEEHARQLLDQQQSTNYPTSNHIQSNAINNNSSNNAAGGFLDSFSQKDSKDEKRKKQEEYARQIAQSSNITQTAANAKNAYNNHNISNSHNPYNASMNSVLPSSATSMSSNNIPSTTAVGFLDNFSQKDNKDEKRKKQEEYARQIAQSSSSSNTNNKETAVHRNNPDASSASLGSYAGYPSNHTAITNNAPSSGGGFLDNFSHKDSKDDKRKKQEEYARQIAQSAGNNPVSNNNRNVSTFNHSYSAVPVNIPSSTSAGGFLDNFSQIDSKDEKRKKQEEYARQIAQSSANATNAYNNSSFGTNGGYGGYNPDSNPPTSYLSSASSVTAASNNIPSSFSGGGFLDNFSQKDSKDEKRKKQEEYARQIAMSANNNPPNSTNRSTNNYHDRNSNHSYGGYPVNSSSGSNHTMMDNTGVANNSNNNNSLFPSAHNNHVSAYPPLNNGDNYQAPSSSVGGGFLDNFSQKDSKDEKRKKQEEYARQLQKQQQIVSNNNGSIVDKNKDNAYPGNSNSGYDNYNRGYDPTAAYSSNNYYDYPSDNHQPVRGGLGDYPYNNNNTNNTNGYNEHNNKNSFMDSSSVATNKNNITGNKSKLLEKTEYARLLQQQMSEKQRAKEKDPELSPRKHTYEHNGNNNGNGGSNNPLLGPGWEMGPLGVPVRKTLEVGDRKQQKHFQQQVLAMAQTGLSPEKPGYSGASGYNIMASSPTHANNHSNMYGNNLATNLFNNSNNTSNTGGTALIPYSTHGPSPLDPLLLQAQSLQTQLSTQYEGVLSHFASAEDQEKAKKAQQKLIQQQQLQLQIDAKQKEKEAEKRKRKEEEAQEIERLQHEQALLQKRFLDEENAQKMKLLAQAAQDAQNLALVKQQKETLTSKAANKHAHGGISNNSNHIDDSNTTNFSSSNNDWFAPKTAIQPLTNNTFAAPLSPPLPSHANALKPKTPVFPDSSNSNASNSNNKRNDLFSQNDTNNDRNPDVYTNSTATTISNGNGHGNPRLLQLFGENKDNTVFDDNNITSYNNNSNKDHFVLPKSPPKKHQKPPLSANNTNTNKFNHLYEHSHSNYSNDYTDDDSGHTTNTHHYLKNIASRAAANTANTSNSKSRGTVSKEQEAEEEEEDGHWRLSTSAIVAQTHFVYPDGSLHTTLSHLPPVANVGDDHTDKHRSNNSKSTKSNVHGYMSSDNKSVVAEEGEAKVAIAAQWLKIPFTPDRPSTSISTSRPQDNIQKSGNDNIDTNNSHGNSSTDIDSRNNHSRANSAHRRIVSAKLKTRENTLATITNNTDKANGNNDFHDNNRDINGTNNNVDFYNNEMVKKVEVEEVQGFERSIRHSVSQLQPISVLVEGDSINDNGNKDNYTNNNHHSNYNDKNSHNSSRPVSVSVRDHQATHISSNNTNIRSDKNNAYDDCSDNYEHNSDHYDPNEDNMNRIDQSDEHSDDDLLSFVNPHNDANYTNNTSNTNKNDDNEERFDIDRAYRRTQRHWQRLQRLHSYDTTADTSTSAVNNSTKILSHERNISYNNEFSNKSTTSNISSNNKNTCNKIDTQNNLGNSQHLRLGKHHLSSSLDDQAIIKNNHTHYTKSNNNSGDYSDNDNNDNMNNTSDDLSRPATTLSASMRLSLYNNDNNTSNNRNDEKKQMVPENKPNNMSKSGVSSSSSSASLRNSGHLVLNNNHHHTNSHNNSTTANLKNSKQNYRETNNISNTHGSSSNNSLSVRRSYHNGSYQRVNDDDLFAEFGL